ncbi:GntR family transcriptional regulator [Streptomyces sp. NPDC002917]|uniref:GntR family transcriptional regulator n=1 Tax=Streptomyces sp. NPDC002917 TaxID=3364671 RepID=UPI0036B10528
MPSRRHTIADDLRTRISTGHLKDSERLASKTQLAAHYKVSAATLRNALALLQAEGLVERAHGKGNVVRPPLRRLTYVGGGRKPVDPALQDGIRTTNTRARRHLRTLLMVSANSPVTEFLRIAH